MSEVTLGLGPSPRPVHIYIDHEKGPYGWYTLDTTATPPVAEPLEYPSLTGFVKLVEVIEKEFKGDVNEKLQIHVAAGARRYIIRSGLYTAFSRCVLAALARLKAEHYLVPLIIEPDKSDRSSNVVFANVYNAENGRKISYDYPKEDEVVDQLLEHVRAIVAGASGEEPPPRPRSREQSPAAAPPPTRYLSGREPKSTSIFPPRGDLANTAYAPTPKDDRDKDLPF